MTTGAIHGALRKARVLSLMPLIAEATGIYLQLAARVTVTKLWLASCCRKEDGGGKKNRLSKIRGGILLSRAYKNL